MYMVSGGSDILFEALNAGRVVGKIGRGGFFLGGALFSDTEWGQTFVHTSLTHICVFSDTAFLSCLIDIHLIFLLTLKGGHFSYALLFNIFYTSYKNN